MPRLERSAHAARFAASADFNEQLYDALRKSPWWMISIAAHGLLFLISTMILMIDEIRKKVTPALPLRQ